MSEEISREDQVKYGPPEKTKHSIKIPPRQVKTFVESHLLHYKVLMKEGQKSSIETQAAIIDSGIEKVDELLVVKDLAKLKLALGIINQELDLPNEVILDTLYDSKYVMRLKRRGKTKRTSFWVNTKIGCKIEKVSDSTGLSYSDLIYLAFLCSCVTSQNLPAVYKERASVDLERALLDVEEIKNEWLKLVDNVFSYFFAKMHDNSTNINQGGYKNSAGEVFKPHDSMTPGQHDRGWLILHDRGYKGERITHAFNLIKSISSVYAQKVDAFIRIQETQQLFELEKQLPTQSLNEETVRAEYRFFNHNPKYTEIRAINPGQGRNKIIQFVS